MICTVCAVVARVDRGEKLWDVCPRCVARISPTAPDAKAQTPNVGTAAEVGALIGGAFVGAILASSARAAEASASTSSSTTPKARGDLDARRAEVLRRALFRVLAKVREGSASLDDVRRLVEAALEQDVRLCRGVDSERTKRARKSWATRKANEARRAEFDREEAERAAAEEARRAAEDNRIAEEMARTEAERLGAEGEG